MGGSKSAPDVMAMPGQSAVPIHKKAPSMDPMGQIAPPASQSSFSSGGGMSAGSEQTASDIEGRKRRVKAESVLIGGGGSAVGEFFKTLLGE